MLIDINKAVNRVAVGIVGASVGAMTGFLAQSIWTCRENYEGSPSVVICMTIGAGLGFVTAIGLGNRSITGRPAILVGGLLCGIVTGAVFGVIWAKIEFMATGNLLRSAGVPDEFIHRAKSGIVSAYYESIGLQGGICLGALVGVTSACLWIWKIRSNALVLLGVVALVSLVLIGGKMIEVEFRQRSARDVKSIRARWEEMRVKQSHEK